MIKMQEYTLPDLYMLELKESKIEVWEPDTTYVVLGQRDDLDSAVNEENAIVDEIQIMQRPTGGHSVVISPNTIVVSIISFQSSLTKIKEFFRNCNNIIIGALEEQGVENLSIQGISDIVLNGKKIVGSSMYRGKNFLFFHAVINISESIDTISKYLKHPKTEPDYREGRKHSDFVTSLQAENYQINRKSFINSLRKAKIN